MINRISMFKTAKPYSPSFEAKGKITYQYQRVSDNFFDRSITLPDTIKNQPSVKQVMERAKEELKKGLLASGVIAQDDDGLFFKNMVINTIINPGDDEIPDVIDMPNNSLVVRDVNIDKVIGEKVILCGNAEVKDVTAQNLDVFNNAKITETADVSGAILMNGGEAENIRAKHLILFHNSQITGSADVSGEMFMQDESQANNVKARYIEIQDTSKITGTLRAFLLRDFRLPEFVKLFPVKEVSE